MSSHFELSQIWRTIRTKRFTSLLACAGVSALLISFQNCAQLSWQGGGASSPATASPVTATSSASDGLKHSGQGCYQPSTKSLGTDYSALKNSPGQYMNIQADKIGFSEFKMNTQQLTLFAGTMFVSSDSKVYVQSACGTFASSDSGKSFSSLDLSAAGDSNEHFFADGANIYVGGNDLYSSKDGGKTFSKILDLTIAKASLASSSATAFQCAQVSPGVSFGIRNILASGDDIFVGTALGFFASHDHGVTFFMPTLTSGGFDVTMAALNGGTVLQKVGQKIYFAVGGQGNPNNYSFAPVGGGACAKPATLPDYSLFVSNDNGNTFTALSAAGHNLYGAGFRGDDIYVSAEHYPFAALPNKSWFGLGVSHDSGNTFTTAVTAGPGLAPFLQTLLQQVNATSYSGGYRVPYAFVGNSVFTTALDSQNSFILDLVKSTDDGQSFQIVQVDANYPVGMLQTFNLASLGNSLFVMTDHGLYISRDGGQTFPEHQSFSSSYCVYPWWAALGLTVPHSASGGGEHIFLVNQSQSLDDGLSFQKVNQTGTALPTNPIVSLTFDGTTVLSLLSANTVPGFLWWQYENNNTKFVGTSTSYQSGSGASLFQIPNATAISRYYLSADGNNLILPVATYAAQNNLIVTDAYSEGNRIVASVFGAKNKGLVVFDNGVMTSSLNSPSVTYLSVLEGGIFAMKDSLSASFDNGSSWSSVIGAPAFANTIIDTGNNLFTFSGGGNLFMSKDKGKTFAPWVGNLGSDAPVCP